MLIRPLVEEERKYTYIQSPQLCGQTGAIGYLKGSFGESGNDFFTSWENLVKQWKTEEFDKALDKVMYTLRIGEKGLLRSRTAMEHYVMKYPECSFNGAYCAEYGFRVELEGYVFLLRCNPSQDDYNFYCFCYVQKWLDAHMQKAKSGIRFIDSCYNELFRVADGGEVMITYASGEVKICICRFIDEYHAEIGSNLYHICQFAELMERQGAVCAPVKENMGEDGPQKM